MSVDLREISAQRMYEHVRNIAAIGPREDGTEANHQAANYVAENLSSLGLQVEKQFVPCWVIEPISSSLKLLKPKELQIKCYHGNLSGVTAPGGVNGTLEFVGKGFEEDVNGKDLKGKIAIGWQADYWEKGEKPGDKLLRVEKLGAIGMLFAHKRSDDTITCWPLNSEPANTPFVSISYPDFLMIRDLMNHGSVEVALAVLGEPKRGKSPTVFCVIPGTELADEMIGINGSHLETVPMSPGANDNAAGQAVLLELARYFQANHQKRSILLVSNGGEESGYWGTESFINTNREWLEKSLKGITVVDQMGGTDPIIFARATSWIEDIAEQEASNLGYRLTKCTDPKVLPTPKFIGDAYSFYNSGFPTLAIAGWPSDFFYHTEQDTPDKVNANSLKVVGDITAAVTMRLASK